MTTINRLSPTSAIIGTGFMGWVHTEALRRLGVHVAGILGSSPQRSQQAAAELAIPRAYASLSELLSDPDVQCVHVATPNRLHFDLVRQCLQAGKHVLCEKPLAMNSSESRALVQLSAQNPHLAAGVNYNIRSYPLCHEVRERIADGRLGHLLHIHGSYVQDWLLRAEDYNWRILAEEGGALRAVADIGTHWLDLIQWMTGLSVEAVCADLGIVHPVRFRPAGEVRTFAAAAHDAAADRQTNSRIPVPVSTEDFAFLLIRFHGGVRAALHVSQVTAGRKNCLRFEIAGSEASVAWNSERPEELWLGHRDRANELLVRDPALLSPAAARSASYPGGHAEGYADSFKACFRRFYESVRSAQPEMPPTYPTFEDGHREIVLCEAILQSHRTQQWVRV